MGLEAARVNVNCEVGMTKIFFLRNIRNSFLEGFDPVFFLKKNVFNINQRNRNVSAKMRLGNRLAAK